jgi:hypothetical protein
LELNQFPVEKKHRDAKQNYPAMLILRF